MSMHKTPLTTIEETGLIAHGFGRDIGRPSQAADIFRHGVAWGQMSVADQIASIQKQIEHEMPFDKKLRNRFAELLVLLQTQQQPVTSHGSVNSSNVLGFADELETAVHEVASGSRKPSKIPVEPILALIQFARNQAQEPEIKPPTKDFICGKCGYDCNLVRKELDTFTSHDMNDNLIERKYIVADVTSCCQGQEFYNKTDPDDAEPTTRQHGDEVHWIAPSEQEEAPFIPWNGGACPVSPHDIVEYTLRGSPDVVNESMAMFIEFKYGRDRLPSDCEIISYRVKNERLNPT